ncbi:MAG: PH domain-containing protein [Nitrospirota bacterium]|nr:PH domain-containing protein [Nitrospirota bacterium]
MVANLLPNETVRWEAYPSWSHFSWLYLFTFMAVFRVLLGIRLGINGWETWLGGAITLLVCVAILRRWAHYILTSQRIIIENGLTGHTLQELPINAISEIDLKQGPLAAFFQIGSLEIHTPKNDQLLTLRGVNNPDVLKTRLEAMMSPSPHSS